MSENWNVVLDAFGRQEVVSSFDTEEEANNFVELTYPAYFKEHDEVHVSTGFLGITRVNRSIVVKPNIAHLETSLSDRQLSVKTRLIELEVYSQSLQLAVQSKSLSQQEQLRMESFLNDIQQLQLLQTLKNEQQLSELQTASEAHNAARKQREIEREIELAELNHRLDLKRISRESSPLLGWMWRWLGGRR